MMKIDVEPIVREYIDKTVHMSLATAKQDAPWVCEVHFAYDDNLNLYFRSLRSRRHSQEIAGNAKVAGSIIDKFAVGEPVVGVYFEGLAELLGAGDGQNTAAQCLKDRLRIVNDILGEAASEEGHQLYKLTVANWYVFGSFGAGSYQKHKLEWNAK